MENHQPAHGRDAKDAKDARDVREPLRPKMRRDRNKVTPFGEVLTDYMSRQRPIWTTGKLGSALGIRRQTVANWIYHDITPPIEVMLEVLAKLNIPISVMVDAYHRRGIPTPVLAPPETIRELAGSPPAQPGQPAPQQRQPTEEETQRAWHDMLEQTRAIMRATGFPEPALDSLLASIEERRDVAESFSAYITREHMNQQPTQQPGQAPQRNTGQQPPLRINGVNE